MILVLIAVNTALFGEELAAVMLVEDARTAGEGVDMSLLRHNFAHYRLWLKKNSARYGGHK